MKLSSWIRLPLRAPLALLTLGALACSDPAAVPVESGNAGTAGAGAGSMSVAGSAASAGSSSAGAGGSATQAGSSGAGGLAQAGGVAGVQTGGAAGYAGSAVAGGGGNAGASSAIPNFFAVSSGEVQVFVNGTSLGQSPSAGALLSVAATLNAGAENIIAIRASSAAAAMPYLQAEVTGAFGKAGTSTQWKAKAAASDDEKTGSAWAAKAYDDRAWATAKDVNVAPTAAELTDGPARGIWTPSASDATAIFRMKFYVPNDWSAAMPYGFGKGVTGGQGGTVVKVTTAAQLAAEVTGNTAKIIQVSGSIDFTASEGTVSKSCCYVAECATGQSESITDDLGACKSAGKTTFSCVFDKAGTTPLAVGSNKTIIGVGPKATIKGKGFTLTKNVSNIAIRNLTITSINPQVVWGGDAITISGAKNVWIDHTKISLIGRQFFVSGFDPATNVTLSYNELDGSTPYSATCNGAHYWAMLMAGSDDTITALGNWIHHTSGRGPHAGGLDTEKINMHFVNDYYLTVLGHAADPSLKANLLFEGTYFQDVTTPFTSGYDGYAYAPVASNLSGTDAACKAALGRSCVANASNSTKITTYPLDQAALTSFGAYQGSLLVPYPAAEVPFSVPHLAGPGHI